MFSTRLACIVLVGLSVTQDARSFRQLRAESPEPPVGDLISYKRDVRPILQANCQGCHQPAKAEGKYVMTDFDRLLRGGDSGDAAIVAGQPEASYLINLITPVDGEASMLRGRPPLGDAERQLIAEWVRQGAKDDSQARGAIYDQGHPPQYHQLPSITSLDYSPDGEIFYGLKIRLKRRRAIHCCAPRRVIADFRYAILFRRETSIQTQTHSEKMWPGFCTVG